MTKHGLTVTCRSTRGIVAAISSYLADRGYNIVDSAQFDDMETGNLFMRVSFLSEEGVAEDDIREGFGAVAERFGMTFAVRDEATKS